MLKNFITITFRNFIHQKVFSLINILGLSVGLTFAFLIFIYIQDEINYDRMQLDARNTYCVGADLTFENRDTFTAANTPSACSTELKRQFPSI
jgi:putative ABC transport system permease protein